MNITNLSQAQLVAELNDKNHTAFKQLFDTYYNELCVFANTLVKDKSLAEDIVQDLITTLWQKSPNLVIKTSLRSYLYKSVYNRFINNCRKHKRELSLIEKLRGEAMSTFAALNNDLVDENIKLVRVAIDRLPPKCKEVFVMNKVQGLKYREIADELDLSIKTVEAHVSKAISRIKESVEKEKTLI